MMGLECDETLCQLQVAVRWQSIDLVSLNCINQRNPMLWNLFCSNRSCDPLTSHPESSVGGELPDVCPKQFISEFVWLILGSSQNGMIEIQTSKLSFFMWLFICANLLKAGGNHACRKILKKNDFARSVYYDGMFGASICTFFGFCDLNSFVPSTLTFRELLGDFSSI